MNQNLIISKAAETDLADAYQWYESQRKGLSESFLLCAEELAEKEIRLVLKCPANAEPKNPHCRFKDRQPVADWQGKGICNCGISGQTVMGCSR